MGHPFSHPTLRRSAELQQHQQPCKSCRLLSLNQNNAYLHQTDHLPTFLLVTNYNRIAKFGETKEGTIYILHLVDASMSSATCSFNLRRGPYEVACSSRFRNRLAFC